MSNNGYDFFDGPPEDDNATQSGFWNPLTWWSTFRVLERLKKLLYVSTAVIFMLSLSCVVMGCVAVSKLDDPYVQGLIGGCIAATMLIFLLSIVQINVYKDNTLVISVG